MKDENDVVKDVLINGERYVHERYALSRVQEAMALLSDVYGKLYCEAFYDPTNEKMQKFAEPLAVKMHEANSILGFKK